MLSPAAPMAVRSAVDHDPIRSRLPLPLTATYYPLGFPLEIITNAREVLAAAAELWTDYPDLSPAAPARLNVAVEGQTIARTERTTIRGREHLVFIAQGSENVAVGDLSRGTGFASVTAETVADRAGFRYAFLEPLVYLIIDSLHTAPVHAACVGLPGGAILLCGPSGAGKTSLAYACALRGWKFISGDATHVLRQGGSCTLAGRPNPLRFRVSARSLFPELNDFPPFLRPNGKWDIEVACKSLGLAPGYCAEARALVFLDRSPEPTPAETLSFPRETAQAVLEEVLCYGDEATRSEQRATLSRLLDLPVVTLQYHDFDQAERELRRLIA